MATQLIKHLKECAKNDATYKPLESQWAMDELLIAKALQNICIHFPHYSRHDESHSRQILVHIERLLGEENISKLTATDTWLLLEAAYLHDIGMLVTDKQLNDNFEEIKKHAESMKYTANADLLIVIKALLASKENTAEAIFAKVKLEAFQSLKLLREIIADFYRKKHPEQAGKIIAHPALEIGLNSPRNELLPARFFGLLSKICEYHGASFEKVMELPKQQVGVGTDDCHPLFVACLLRLGDLLDLDDNRFCPVMMKMAGELPPMSKAHHEKHLAIRHFRADPELIEIEAECSNYESYIETTKWFGWLREEVKNQMGRWFEIVPARHFGLLPSVGDLKVHLKNWQVFSEDKRPQFTLDRDRMFELLQGAGLYDGKEQAMRELLQNAVDATLIRIWREHGEDAIPKPTSFIKRDSAPRDETVREILKKYPLDVKIEKENEDEQSNYWRITITDQGTGISRYDLEFLMSMGSSKKNYKKRAIADKMPIWMKPSGIFGIGFHSVFLLTDEVIIETRSIDTGETLVINLTNPTNNTEHGNIYFQIISEQKTIELPPNSNRKEKPLKVSPWDFSRYGCQLSFVYKASKESYPEHHVNKADSRIKQAFQNHDGLTDHTTDFYIFKIADGITDFFDNSLMSGKFTFAEDEPQNLSATKKENNGFYYYSKEQELELTNLSFESNIQYSYRWGKIIFNVTSTQNFFRASANFLDAEADKILNISRNKFKEDELPKLHNKVYKAIQEFFNDKDEGEKYYKQLDEFEKIKIAIEYQSQKWQFPKPNYFIDWKLYKGNITINGVEESRPINELKNYDNIIVCNYKNSHFPGKLNPPTPAETQIKLDEILKRHPNSVLLLKDWNSIDIVYPLVSEFLKESGFKSTYLELPMLTCSYGIVKLNKNINEEPITEDMLKIYCLAKFITKNSHEPATLLVRSTIPCLSKYRELELKDPKYLPPLIGDGLNHFIWHSFELDLISPRMLFPLARIGDKITVGDLDILAKRVYKNQTEKTTVEEKDMEMVENIKMAYQKFIQMLDALMVDEPEWRTLRGNEFSS